MKAPDKAEMLDGIRRWVEIESHTADVAGVNRVMDACAADWARAGARVERVPGRDGHGDHLVVSSAWGGDGPCVLVLCHLDTVHPRGTIKDLAFRVDGDQRLRTGHLRHEGRRLPGARRLPGDHARGPDDTAAAALHLYVRRGGRQPDLARADRSARPQRQVCPGHRAVARRRQDRDIAQGRRALRAHGAWPSRPFRRTARGGSQCDPRGCAGTSSQSSR